MDRYFKKAGNLDNENQYFHPAGNLDRDVKVDIFETFSNDISVEEIKKYLESIVSGKEYDIECELGTLCGGGSYIVSFEELKEMVDAGCYNFIQAECLNENMISIKYQEFSKEYSRKF